MAPSAGEQMLFALQLHGQSNACRVRILAAEAIMSRLAADRHKWPW